MNEYDFGQTVRIEFETYDEHDQLANLTGLRLLVFGPSDASPTVIPHQSVATGRFFAEFAPTTPGVWTYQPEVPSGTKAVKPQQFRVRPRAMPPGP